MGFVADFVSSAVSAVVGIVEDVVTLDIGGLVDTAVGMVEGIFHTITHPTEDPFATIMLAVAVYSGYNAYTAEAAVASEATLAGQAAYKASLAKAGVTATTATASQLAIADIAMAASVDAVYLQAGASPGFWTGDITSPSGTVVRSGSQSLATGTIGGPSYGTALSGPSFDAVQLGTSIGKTAAIDSVALATAGVAVRGSQLNVKGELITGKTAAETAALRAEAASAALYEGQTLQVGTFGGVGPESAAGSMTGYGGGPGGGITGVQPGYLDFLSDYQSAWTDTEFSLAEEAAPSEYAWTDEAAEWGERTASNFWEGVERVPERVTNWYDETVQSAEEWLEKPFEEKVDTAWKGLTDAAKKEADRQYPIISDPSRLVRFLPTSTDELIELGVDAMAESFANWSPTISYQAGGDPGSATSESYPSFTRAETGILGDPFNLEGQDLALTASGLAAQLQQQRGLPLGQQEMGMAPTFYDPTAFRQRQAPAEELKQLMDPSYAVNQYQQPMVNEMINQLNANAQVRGLAPSAEGVSRGVAPLLSKLRQDNLSALNRAAGLDLEATRGAMGQRAGDITAQQQYQDIGVGADVARKNITLNSLLALAQMSKPTIIGGTTSRGSSQAAVPGTVFSGSVPVGNILSTGWDWLTGDDDQDVNTYGSSQLATGINNIF